MIDLSALAVIIPVRIDTSDRARNLGIVLDYFATFFRGQEIVIVEQDVARRAAAAAEGCEGLSYFFRESSGCFHKTANLNLGVSLSSRPLAMAYDCDVLFHPRAIATAYEMIRSGRAEFVFPFNEVMLQIKRERVERGIELEESFFETLPHCRLGEHPADAEQFEFLYGDSHWPCTGGALMFDRRAFFLHGGYNENIISYGCEDVELYSRLKTLGAELRRLAGYNCFHLEHRRGPDSHYNNFLASNEAEWARVRAMDAEELRSYVNRGLKHVVLDPRRGAHVENTEQHYSIIVNPTDRPSLDDLAIIVAVNGISPAGLEGFLWEVDNDFLNCQVFLVEVESNDFRRFYHRRNVHFVHLGASRSADWLPEVLGRTDRPIVALTGTTPALGSAVEVLEQLRDGETRVARGPQASNAVFFDRETLAGLAGGHEIGGGPQEVREAATELLRAAGHELRVVQTKSGSQTRLGPYVASAAHTVERVGRKLKQRARKVARRLRDDRPTKGRLLPAAPAGRKPPRITIVVTTHGSETDHTQQCIERIASWKAEHHELVVVAHDESPLLRAYLEYAERSGVIDRLLLAEPYHGHVRGVNLGFAHASGEIFVNVCVDVRVGPGLVDHCARRLTDDPKLGLIGWHYNWAPDHEGTSWRGDRLVYTPRPLDGDRVLTAERISAIANADWFSGRVLRAIGTRQILCSNGSFFALRRKDWLRVGGFDERRFPHYWADDYLCYALLDQGLNIANLPRHVRCSQRPDIFESLSDSPWRGDHDPRRGRDELSWTVAGDPAVLDSADAVLLDVIARSIADDAVVTLVGEERGIPPRLAARARRPTNGDETLPSDVLLTSETLSDAEFERLIRPGGICIRIAAGDGDAPRVELRRREAPRLAYERGGS